MTLVRKEIKICLGSSCFSRGNKKTLQLVQQYLEDHELERDVILKGNHCFSDCSSGPVLMIGTKVYKHVTRDNVLDILHKEFDNL